MEKACLFLFHRKALPEERRRGLRFYWYDQLFQILKNQSDFELIEPVNQALDEQNPYADGFCRGYGKIWETYLSWVEQASPLTKEGWEELLTDKSEHWNSMPLTAEVRKAQPKFVFNFSEKRRSSKARYFPEFKELVRSTLASILPSSPEEGQAQCLFVIQFGNIKNIPPIDKMLNSFCPKPRPTQVNRWHEWRLYLDRNRRVHVFDPNLGWFRSQDQNPRPDALARTLSLIFEILSYQEYYNVVRYRQEELKLEPKRIKVI